MSNYNEIGDYETRKLFLENLKILNKSEKEKIGVFLKLDKNNTIEKKLKLHQDKSKIDYVNFVEKLPILETQKYNSGYKLFFTNLPYWIFFIICIIISIFAFIKHLSLIPLLGLISCCYLLTGMAYSNWLWFGAWLLIGLIVYFLYSRSHSKLHV
jgi:hypothetical protein